jgi:hypothetical protein
LVTHQQYTKEYWDDLAKDVAAKKKAEGQVDDQLTNQGKKIGGKVTR